MGKTNVGEVPKWMERESEEGVNSRMQGVGQQLRECRKFCYQRCLLISYLKQEVCIEIQKTCLGLGNRENDKRVLMERWNEEGREGGLHTLSSACSECNERFQIMRWENSMYSRNTKILTAQVLKSESK